jgi:hypothetical protein
VYSVANRSALMRVAGPERQGTVMSARFSLTQATQVIGLGAGALLVSLLGARWGFALVGVGLAGVATLSGALRLDLPSGRGRKAAAPVKPPPAS